MASASLGAKKIGIVTVTYNSSSVLDGFLSSLRRQDWGDYILYCVDNASRDDTIECLRKEALTDARIELIANAENRGVAVGNNQGIRAALADGCETVLLLNNDIEFSDDFLGTFREQMDVLDADILIPKMYYFEPSNLIWCAGGKFVPTRAFATHHFGENEVDEGQYDEARKIEYAPTCCMLIRREIFDRIGLMDENYFVYYDDTDFCYRARASGVSFWYTPRVNLLHKVSSLTGKHSDFSLLNGARGKTYFIRKNCKLSWPLWLLMFQLLFFYRLFSPKYGLKGFLLYQSGFWQAMKLNIPTFADRSGA